MWRIRQITSYKDMLMSASTHRISLIKLLGSEQLQDDNKEGVLMEQAYNIPIQVFCVVSTMGDLTPVRFRFESTDHQIITVEITQILSHKETRLAGTKEIIYTCIANIENCTQLFNLKYNVNLHRWTFVRFLT